MCVSKGGKKLNLIWGGRDGDGEIKAIEKCMSKINQDAC
jgi:hypothetical protein